MFGILLGAPDLCPEHCKIMFWRVVGRHGCHGRKAVLISFRLIFMSLTTHTRFVDGESAIILAQPHVGSKPLFFELIDSLIHPLTHSLTHLLTYLLTYLVRKLSGPIRRIVFALSSHCLCAVLSLSLHCLRIVFVMASPRLYIDFAWHCYAWKRKRRGWQLQFVVRCRTS